MTPESKFAAISQNEKGRHSKRMPQSNTDDRLRMLNARMKVKIKGDDEHRRVQQIHFMSFASFDVHIADRQVPTRQEIIHSEDIETLVTEGGIVLYGESNLIDDFANSVINAFVKGGGTRQDAEEYYRNNYC